MVGVDAYLRATVLQGLDGRIGLRAIVVGSSTEHLGLLACLVEATGNLSNQLCHLEGRLLTRSLLIQEFEHLCDERLAHDKLHANFAILLLQELLPDHQLSELRVLVLRFLLLFTASDELTKFILCRQTSKRLLPSQLGHLSLKLVLVDVQLLRLSINATLALLIDTLLLQQGLLISCLALGK